MILNSVFKLWNKKIIILIKKTFYLFAGKICRKCGTNICFAMRCSAKRTLAIEKYITVVKSHSSIIDFKKNEFLFNVSESTQFLHFISSSYSNENIQSE